MAFSVAIHLRFGLVDAKCLGDVFVINNIVNQGEDWFNEEGENYGDNNTFHSANL
jgi:hypothetical protein